VPLEFVPIQSYILLLMLSFSRKTDYALIAIAHLVANEGQTVSAREIATSHGLPQALVMKILKVLHHAGIVECARGPKGG
jgi:DNA-binding IscR family transcriptional regulator